MLLPYLLLRQERRNRKLCQAASRLHTLLQVLLHQCWQGRLPNQGQLRHTVNWLHAQLDALLIHGILLQGVL
jgi:hypothetical protein